VVILYFYRKHTSSIGKIGRIGTGNGVGKEFGAMVRIMGGELEFYFILNWTVKLLGLHMIGRVGR